MQTILIAVLLVCMSDAAHASTHHAFSIREFARRYAFLSQVDSFCAVPFPVLDEDAANNVLMHAAYKGFLFPADQSQHGRPMLHFQVHGVDCRSHAAVLSCRHHYLVVQGGFGHAITRVFGPVTIGTGAPAHGGVDTLDGGRDDSASRRCD